MWVFLLLYIILYSMGKRSDFERIEKDYYRTFDEKAINSLLPFLRTSMCFIEPCAGDGIMTKQLLASGLICVGQYDIDPQAENIVEKNALELTREDVFGADVIITNPPWSRDKKSGYLLHNLIETFANLKPTWLLFDSDWAYTKQSKDLLNKYCTDIVAVGRLKWIEGTNTSGKDNCAWYRFTSEKSNGITFHNL